MYLSSTTFLSHTTKLSDLANDSSKLLIKKDFDSHPYTILNEILLPLVVGGKSALCSHVTQTT